MMNCEQALSYIHSIPKFSRVLGNDLLRELLFRLGDPHKSLKFIHIGGTNGKGSTCTMISEILIDAGFKTGLFTSPFLMRFNERIRINGEPIPDNDLVALVEYVKSVSEKYSAEVSEFAFITAAAMVYFKRQGCDFVVLEVGLGGRLDATNVIEKSVVTALTAIGLDHCQYLGNTVDEVSREKLGIVKSGSPLVLYPRQDKVVFENAKMVCKQVGSKLIVPELPAGYNSAERSFMYKQEKYRLAMDGEFQAFNAVTAIEIAEKLRVLGYSINRKNIKNGLQNAKIDGRLDRSENIIIDGAHNPQAVKTLLGELDKNEKTIHFLTAVMDDKDYKEIVRLISKFCLPRRGSVTVTELDMPRCLSAEKLADEYKKHGIYAKCAHTPSEALRNIIHDNSGLICVCGSLYLAGIIKKII